MGKTEGLRLSMVWVLVAVATNDVMVPCLVWADEADALAFCREYVASDMVPNKRFKLDLDHTTSEIKKHFFTSYYGGCGSVWAFELRRVDEGKPFIRFDLD